jgi:hypothetical protein
MNSIEDRILSFQEAYIVKNLNPPKLLILPFNDYLELQEYAEDLNKAAFATFSRTHMDFSVGKMIAGMIITFDYEATEIVIKGAPDGNTKNG